ncbi:hypothetical protein ACLOJK_036661 [Asimina triloba]
MSVEEYDIKFRSLARFVPWALTDRRETAHKFQEGLRLSIRRGLAPLKTVEYGDILDRARMIEQEEEEQDRIREKRKGTHVGGQSKKQKVSTDRAAPVQKGARGHRSNRQSKGQLGQWYVFNVISLGTSGGTALCYNEAVEPGYLEAINGKCEKLHRAEGEEVEDSISNNLDLGQSKGHRLQLWCKRVRPTILIMYLCEF